MPEQLTINFHNTTNEPSQVVEEYEAKAKTQEDLVFELFAPWVAGAEPELSPSEVHSILVKLGKISRKVPLTSIRRALTNLTNKGLLEKQEKKVIGKFGHAEHKWRFAR